ncbi:hypothetical protein [Mesorhizobium sp.]|uniref:hypothetical protein n=1 Tax=Mesorhizobium sp. TaxID=1871066 RepID=UPI0025DCD774|nr:hypothetical protein [Mesorhizobium sp.]
MEDDERRNLLRMGADRELARHPANATAITRKRIIRTVIHEIVVAIEDARSKCWCIGRAATYRAFGQEEQDRPSPLGCHAGH